MRRIIISFLILVFSTIFSINVRIIHEEMMVANELQTSQSRPDIIIVDNGVFEFWSVPNRGRVLYRVTFGDEEFLYFNPFPLPYYDESEGKYILEFGGIYLSVPWNPRSVQPYNLDYKIKESKDAVKLFLFGENPTEKLRSEIEIFTRDGGKCLSIKVSVVNRSDEEKALNFSVISILALDDTKILDSSLEDLKGKSLKDFSSKFEKVYNFKNGWIGVKSLKSDKSMILKFRGSSQLKFMTWGLNYEDYMGGAPYAKFIVVYPKRILKPNEKSVYQIDLCVD